MSNNGSSEKMNYDQEVEGSKALSLNEEQLRQ